MTFENGFDNFACVGDSLGLDLGNGLRAVATLKFDSDCKPTDFDCYDTEQITNWCADSWFYVGVVVSIVWEGVVLEDSSLWGIECNLGSDNSYLTEVANDLLGQLLPNVANKLSDMLCKLHETVERIPTGWDKV